MDKWGYAGKIKHCLFLLAEKVLNNISEQHNLKLLRNASITASKHLYSACILPILR